MHRVETRNRRNLVIYSLFYKKKRCFEDFGICNCYDHYIFLKKLQNCCVGNQGITEDWLESTADCIFSVHIVPARIIQLSSGVCNESRDHALISSFMQIYGLILFLRDGYTLHQALILKFKSAQFWYRDTALTTY